MVYTSRRRVYSFFIIIFALVFFSIVFLFSFSQDLEIIDSSVSVMNDKVVLKLEIYNTSNHYVRGASVLISMPDQERRAQVPDLAPQQKFELIVGELPISEKLLYDVYLSAPSNKTQHLYFNLDESTIRPVNVEVQLTSQMNIDQTYNMLVKLCNVSNSPLFEVYWIESAEGNFFRDDFVPRTISLDIGDCKFINTPLTPIKKGQAVLKFTLKVGTLVQDSSYAVDIK